jgi:hypothetical protein
MLELGRSDRGFRAGDARSLSAIASLIASRAG